MYDVFAAPASGLPSLPTALVSQESCGKRRAGGEGGDDGSQNIRFM